MHITPCYPVDGQGQDLLKGCRHWTESLLRRDTNLLTVNTHGNGFRLLHGCIQDFGKGGGGVRIHGSTKVFYIPANTCDILFPLYGVQGSPTRWGPDPSGSPDPPLLQMVTFSAKCRI